MKPPLFRTPGGGRRRFMAVLLAAFALCPKTSTATDSLQTLLDRASNAASAFLDRVSEVNCTERVTQEKIAPNGKTIEKRESAFDYLVLLSDTGGELNLVESRVAADSNKKSDDKSPLLVSNGFSMLLLIFHRYYSSSFQFTPAPEDADSGASVAAVNFRHLPGTRSPAALAVRGREYPLDISGTAWIDPQTGAIQKIAAQISNDMEDVGLRVMNCEIQYAPVTFQTAPGIYWLPARAFVEVESRHQHWRNTHVFSAYKRFSVKTKEQASAP